MGQAAGKLPFRIEEEVPVTNTVWTKVNRGVSTENDEPVLVFSHTTPSGLPDGGQRDLALASVRRLKTLRHPRVLRYLNDTTVGDTLYVVTESASPLEAALRSDPALLAEGPLSWGLLQSLEALSFLHRECGIVHGSVSASGALWVTPGGDWKVAGLEMACASCEELLRVPQFRSQPFLPGDVDQCARWPKHALDVSCLGRAVEAVAGGKAAGRVATALARITRVPPSQTPTADEIADAAGLGGSAYAAMMKLIETMPVMPAPERVKVLEGLGNVVAGLPACVTRHKLLPGLVELVGIDPAGSAGAVPVVANASRSLGDAEFDTVVGPAVASLAAANDRGVRLALLQASDALLSRLTPERCEKEVFPLLSNGFSDASPMVRELTVKSMMSVVPLLSGVTVASKVVRALAALQNDPEPGIRTNTTICVGKIAVYIPASQRRGVLTAAFTRALKDPFPPSRAAALSAFSAVLHLLSPKDIACSVFPAAGPALVDPEPQVRTAALALVRKCLSASEEADGLARNAPQASSSNSNANANANANADANAKSNNNKGGSGDGGEGGGGGFDFDKVLHGLDEAGAGGPNGGAAGGGVAGLVAGGAASYGGAVGKRVVGWFTSKIARGSEGGGSGPQPPSNTTSSASRAQGQGQGQQSTAATTGHQISQQQNTSTSGGGMSLSGASAASSSGGGQPSSTSAAGSMSLMDADLGSLSLGSGGAVSGVVAEDDDDDADWGAGWGALDTGGASLLSTTSSTAANNNSSNNNINTATTGTADFNADSFFDDVMDTKPSASSAQQPAGAGAGSGAPRKGGMKLGAMRTTGASGARESRIGAPKESKLGATRIAGGISSMANRRAAAGGVGGGGGGGGAGSAASRGRQSLTVATSESDLLPSMESVSPINQSPAAKGVSGTKSNAQQGKGWDDWNNEDW